MLDASALPSSISARVAPEAPEQRARIGYTVQLHQLPIPTQAAILEALAEGGDLDEAPEWSEADIVQLHWLLLAELEKLQDPETPIEEKIDTLDWVFSRASDDQPFSFASCVRVVGTSPLSPAPYCGLIDVEELRDRILLKARRWLRETLARYPKWAQDLFLADPHAAAARLSVNPQWLNQQVRAREGAAAGAAAQFDLFGVPQGIPGNTH